MMNPAFNGNMFNMNMNMNVNMNMNMNMNMTDEYKITNRDFYFPQMFRFNPLYQAYNNPQSISINDFHKLNELGAGKHGSVGRYRNIYNNQIYAIKIMEQRVFKNKTGKEKDTDYNREILILSNLNLFNCPGIIKLFAFFQDKDNRYLVLEFVEGKTLKALREEHFKEKNEYIKQKPIINILKQLLQILIILHDNFKIIHRDIKPENIILDRYNNIKLLDFGLAVYLQNPNPILVSRKSFKGSRLYVPPEILYSKYRNYDCKVDIFCLGFTMFNIMNPNDINGTTNLPQFTDENNQRTNNYNNNQFYDEWLMNFISTFYSPNPYLRPTAASALQYLLINEHNMRRPSPDLAINKEIINRSASTHISFNIDNFNINTNINKNFKKQFTNVNNFIPEEFLQHDQGSDNKIMTSMKSLIQVLNSVQAMAYIKAQFQSVYNNNIDKQLFIKSYNNIFEDFSLMKKNYAYRNDYEFKINNFISEIFQKNVSQTSGPRPIILFFMMSSIINKEFNELCPNYKNYILDDIFVSKNYSFNNILPYNQYKALCDSLITQINSFKNCKRNPFVDYFYFLGLEIKKCPLCKNILDAEISQCELLQLSIKSEENIIDDLIKNYFDEKYPKFSIYTCQYCQKNIDLKCINFYCLNAPEYLILELEDRSRVYFKDNILLPLYDGKNISYQFVGGIYRKKLETHSEFYSVNREGNGLILYDNDTFQNCNYDLINSENPSMLIYQKIK